MNDFWREGEAINKVNAERIRQNEKDLRELLENKIGRKFVFSILEEGYIFTTTFTKNSQGFFNEGKRDTALKWFNAILDLDPNIFALMCFEFRNKNE